MSRTRSEYNTPEYKAWRFAVFARDNWTCQATGRQGCELEAHHIVPWTKSPHLRYVVSNGITLEKDYHQNTVTGREQEFENQFKRVVEEKKMTQRSKLGQTKKNRPQHSGGGSVERKWRPRNPRMRM